MADKGRAALAAAQVLAAQTRRQTLLQRIQRNAAKAALSNPRTAGLYTGTLTITDNGASLPVFGTNSALQNNATRSVFHTIGGAVQGAGGIKAATIDAGSFTTNYNRSDFIFEGQKVVLRFAGTSAPYRLMIGPQYVNPATAGLPAQRFNNIQTSLTTGSVYMILDFASYGVRRITVEGAQNAYLMGAYFDAASKVRPVTLSDVVHGTMLGDSYVQGATAFGGNYADGVFAQMSDFLGMAITNSGSGGTGWNQSATSVYRFDQRIAAGVGDLALGYYPPEVLFFMASVNDAYANDFTAVQTNARTGLAAARTQYPGVPIIVFGCLPIPGKTGANLLSSENAVAAAVADRRAAGDTLIRFVPIASDANGAWVTGIGVQAVFTAALTAATSGTLETAWTNSTATYTLVFSDGSTRTATLTQGSTAVSWTGAVTATAFVGAYNPTLGNSIYTIAQDYTHPSTGGAGSFAQRYADAVLAWLLDMLST